MNGLVGRSVFGGLVLLCLVAAGASAAVPVIQEGDCVYLTGAPPGGHAAIDEEKHSGSGLMWRSEVLNPDNLVCEAAIERDGLNMLQAWIKVENDPVISYPGAGCRMRVWTGHDFQVMSARGTARGSVTMEGDYSLAWTNLWAGWGSVLERPPILRMDLLEVDALTGRESLAESAELLRLEPLVYVPHNTPRIPFNQLAEVFGRRLDSHFRPGATYRARLVLELSAVGLHGLGVDIGEMPGDNRGARYERIKVCLDPPDETQAVLDRLDSLEAKQCESVRLLLTPQGRRASDCCEAETHFPDGKSAPSCGGTVLNSPAPPPSPALLVNPLQTR